MKIFLDNLALAKTRPSEIDFSNKRPISLWQDPDILHWSNQIRKDKNNSENLINKFLPELLAVLSKAILNIYKHELRDTQIISILSILQSDKGTLLEIKTGEGKTLTTAVIALIKALEGQNIDFLTSSPLLAKRDFESAVVLFKMLGVSLDSTFFYKDLHSGYKECYSKQGVYGDLATFQYDF